MKINFHNTPARLAAHEKVWRDFENERPAFADLPYQKTDEIENFASKNRNKKAVVVFGIGGSSLGGRTLVAALAKTDSQKFYFLDNLDPSESARIFSKIDFKKTLFLVVTKSGGTLETLTQFFAVAKKIPAKNLVAITDPASGWLRRESEKKSWQTFEVPPAVGGRFSVLSPVGLLPAAIAGADVKKILVGAREASELAAFEFAKIHAAEFLRGKNVTVFCGYSSTLESFGNWYAQLLAESVGKSKTVGLTPEVSVGPRDQHSKLQLWRDGPNDKFFIFNAVEKFAADVKIATPPVEFDFLRGKKFSEILAAEFEATVESLTAKKRSLAEIKLAKLDEKSVGKALQFWLLEVYFLGKILGVDPFGQPGVEDGKRRAFTKLN